MKKLLCLSAWVLASGALGCANLPEIERGTCGNQVIERGEDCDSFPAGQCVAAGSTNECRLSCESVADCPAGWGCGADGICRQASGRYELASRPPGATALQLTFADFDGDARDDVLVAEPSRFALHYHDSNASLVNTLAVSSLPSLPAVGDLSADGLADLALARGMVGVSRGRPDRTLAPVSYAPFVVPHQNIRFVALDAVPESSGGQTGQDEVLMISGEGIMSPMDDASLFPIPFDASKVIGEIPAGNLNEGPVLSPCDEFVLAMQGEDRVNVYTPCAFNSANGVAGWNQGSDNLPGVLLPSGVTVAGSALLVDVNRDSHLDIMVGGSDSQLYVAFGVGDGSFHSDPLAVPIAAGDGRMNAQPLLALGEFPLAAGFLNQDDRIDFVLSDRVMVSSAGFGNCAEGYDCTYALGSSWTTARIADLNGNGAADVIAGSSSAFKVDFFNNTGTGLLNHFQIPTNGPADQFTIGDYDGDLLLDVAFKEIGSGSASDSLSVMFGQGFGAPEPPVSVGRIGKIQQIVAGDVSDAVDGIKDLVVLSTADDSGANAKVGMFLGSSDRQIQSPFVLLAEQGTLFPTLRAMVGQFDGDADGHLDLALATTSNINLDTGGTIETNLWLVPSTGDAALDVTTARKSDSLPDQYHPCMGIQAVVDLDRDGIDEIVQFSPSFEGQTPRGALATARAQQGPAGFRRWVFDSDVRSIDEYFFDNPLPGDACVLGPGGGVGGKPEPATERPDNGGGDEPGYAPSYAFPTRIEVADVDGDGAREVAVMGYVEVELGISDSAIVIFPNPGNGRLDADNRIVVTLPDDFVFSFTFINADADREQELVVLAPGGAYLVDVDMAQRTASVRHRLPALFGGFVAASGDVDGDGVEDLAISGTDGLAIFRGLSVLP
jgi:hypothetical protein